MKEEIKSFDLDGVLQKSHLETDQARHSNTEGRNLTQHSRQSHKINAAILSSMVLSCNAWLRLYKFTKILAVVRKPQ